MAERKFLFLDTVYGNDEEHDPLNDSITLAGLTMHGNISMILSEVLGLPDVPSVGDAATSKTYVDFLADLVGFTRVPSSVTRTITTDHDHVVGHMTIEDTGILVIEDDAGLILV